MPATASREAANHSLARRAVVFNKGSKMKKQTEIDGTQPMKCKVPHRKASQIVIESSAHASLREVMKELEQAQKQHPGVAGLTMAIAIVARRAAEAQTNLSRKVLLIAAQNRMPIENHALNLLFEDDGMYIEAASGHEGED